MFNKKIITSALIGSLAFSLFPTNIFANETPEQKICKFLENNQNYKIESMFMDKKDNLFTFFLSDEPENFRSSEDIIHDSRYDHGGIFTKNGEIIKNKYPTARAYKLINGIFIDSDSLSGGYFANGLNISEKEYNNILKSNGKNDPWNGYYYNGKVYTVEETPTDNKYVINTYEIDQNAEYVHTRKLETKKKFLELKEDTGHHYIIKIENNDIYTISYSNDEENIIYKNGKLFFKINKTNHYSNFLFMDEENNVYTYESDGSYNLKIFKNNVILSEYNLDGDDKIGDIENKNGLFLDKNKNHYFFSNKNFYKNGKAICERTPTNGYLTGKDIANIKNSIRKIIKKYSYNKTILENLHNALNTREDIQERAEKDPRVKFIIEEYSRQYFILE